MIKIPIKDIIGMIPEILQYFVPGFIFIFIFRSLCSIKIDSSMQLINSCVISFIWVSLINMANEIWWNNCLVTNLWVIVTISILLSTLFSIIFSKIYVSNWFRRSLANWFGISPYSTAWDNIVSKHGTNVKIYLKDKPYYWTGHLYSYEDQGNNSWFCISKPVKRNSTDNKIIYNQGSAEGSYLAFRIGDVECIEMFV